MHFYMDVFVCSCKMECQSDLLGWFPSEVSLSQCILYCCSLFVLVQVQLANEFYTQLQYTWLQEFIPHSVNRRNIALLIKNGRF